MKCAQLILACAMLSFCAPALAQVEIHVSGAVVHPGTLQIKDGARLSDGALAAKPGADAYFLGAAWLQPTLVANQARLKAGVLYDLGALQRHALADGDLGLAGTTRTLHAWLSNLPVTGRRIPAELAPRIVEATPEENWPLAPGDTLFYPVRPTTVRIVGAVQQPCNLPFKPLAQARDYLDHCRLAKGGDADWAWVIQPDGSIFQRGVALWNLTRGALPLAPGAVIYVPIRASVADHVDPDMNHEIAQFLATQTLPSGGNAP